MLIDALGAEGWYVSLLGVEIWEVHGSCGYLVHVACGWMYKEMVYWYRLKRL